MSEFSDEDLIKLSKFYLSTNLYQFTVFYSQNFDILYNFESPMAQASEDLKVAASQVLQSEEGLSYEDVKIVQHPSEDYIAIYEGNRIKLVLLLKKQAITEIVQMGIKPVLKEFADNFENKFRKELKNYAQYTGSFTNIEDIFKSSFTLDLGLPHITRYKGFLPEDKLEQYMFQAAEKFCKYVGYFYLPNLIFLTKQFVVDEARNIVMSDPAKAKRDKIDPDHIDFPPNEQFYIGMFNLRKLAMIEPIKTEQLQSHSKIMYPATPQ
jgi:hypothetical protein